MYSLLWDTIDIISVQQFQRSRERVGERERATTTHQQEIVPFLQLCLKDMGTGKIINTSISGRWWIETVTAFTFLSCPVARPAELINPAVQFPETIPIHNKKMYNLRKILAYIWCVCQKGFREMTIFTFWLRVSSLHFGFSSLYVSFSSETEFTFC